MWIEKSDRKELYTELSTLSTFFGVNNLVYIVFLKNERFVETDKIKKIKKKKEKSVDSFVLSKLLMFSE